MKLDVLVATGSTQADPAAAASFQTVSEMAAWARDHGYHYVPGTRGVFARDQLAAHRNSKPKEATHG